MKVSVEHLENSGSAFAAELMDLLTKYELHDGKSKMTLTGSGFSIHLDGIQDDCPPECRKCKIIIPPGGGKPKLVCRCDC